QLDLRSGASAPPLRQVTPVLANYGRIMANVVSVNRSSEHLFSKEPVDEIFLIQGKGVSGAAHLGETVKHRSRVKKDPNQPNLRQVHLVHIELIQELEESGFRVRPGTIGETITTSGIDVLALPKGTILSIGGEVELKVTGLRNPCFQLEDRKSTRLNSSHVKISYAVFCLKKKPRL